MFDVFSLSLLTAIMIVVGFIIVFCCVKRYDFAIFGLLLSPLIPAILLPNSEAGIGEQAIGIGSFIRVSVVLLTGAIGLIQFIKLRKLSGEGLPKHFCLLGVFVLITLVSTSYSLDAKLTFIRSASFTAFLFFLLGLNYWLGQEGNLNATLNVCFLAISVCLIVNASSLFLFPEKAWWFAAENRFQGLLGHPNSVGVFCMVSYPVLLWKYQQYKERQKFVIIFFILTCLSLHLLSGSRTSLFSAAFGIVVWLVLRNKKRELILFFAASFCLLFVLIGYGYSPSSLIREKSSNLTHLTGRPQIWKAGFFLAREKPIFGYGYSVGGKIFEDYRFYDKYSPLWSGDSRVSLHNGYLSVFIGIGAIGLIIFCMCLFLPLWKCLQVSSNDFKVFAITILAMGMLANLFETCIIGGRSIDSVMFWIAWVIGGKMIKDDCAPNKSDY